MRRRRAHELQDGNQPVEMISLEWLEHVITNTEQTRKNILEEQVGRSIRTLSILFIYQSLHFELRFSQGGRFEEDFWLAVVATHWYPIILFFLFALA